MGMDSDELKDKATELFNTILSLETEKYDCEQRRINQDYELKELKERQKVQLRQEGSLRGRLGGGEGRNVGGAVQGEAGRVEQENQVAPSQVVRRTTWKEDWSSGYS